MNRKIIYSSFLLIIVGEISNAILHYPIGIGVLIGLTYLMLMELSDIKKLLEKQKNA